MIQQGTKVMILKYFRRKIGGKIHNFDSNYIKPSLQKKV
jgi:hypothetical protein